VGPRAGLDTEARGKILSPLPGIEPRSPGRPACSQTLYCLSYPAYVYPLYSVKILVWNRITPLMRGRRESLNRKMEGDEKNKGEEREED
jgi:hypothetical protein